MRDRQQGQVGTLAFRTVRRTDFVARMLGDELRADQENETNYALSRLLGATFGRHHKSRRTCLMRSP